MRSFFPAAEGLFLTATGAYKNEATVPGDGCFVFIPFFSYQFTIVTPAWNTALGLDG
ncbi:hypothetical protein CLV51_104247 [Chitinophaga niastensis]|uniref:Uncharacterized protein n=1 Tax=Chitinophaga niastensis TaxID=536980 RepID=A0A2P8HH43_CHINA|nr:hypothetical protein CLV51_104247 [Chitinophaga niastensis]